MSDERIIAGMLWAPREHQTDEWTAAGHGMRWRGFITRCRTRDGVLMAEHWAASAGSWSHSGSRQTELSVRGYATMDEAILALVALVTKLGARPRRWGGVRLVGRAVALQIVDKLTRELMWTGFKS